MKFLDERSEPPLRSLLLDLLNRASNADIALQHLRLVGLDFNRAETSNFAQCRLMIGRFNVESLLDDEHSRILRALADGGRLEVRTAPHHVWNPDFSIFRNIGGRDAERDLMLLGAHYFGRPYPLFGLALTAVIDETDAILLATRRFEELWAAGYDVLPAIREHLGV